MEAITPEFKDLQEQNKVTLIAVLTLLTLFVAPLIVFLSIRETLSPAADAINKALLNFEILIAILLFICTIPIIGWLVAFLLAPIAIIAHIVVTASVVMQVMNKTTVKIWVPVKFIK